MSLEQIHRFNANPEAPPEIEKPVEEMMNDLKEIQEGRDHGPGKAFQQAARWLSYLHSEAMKNNDEYYRTKTVVFCQQCEETLELLTNGPKGKPIELPEQQQVLASAAYQDYLDGNKNKYLEYYEAWLKKHRAPNETDKYKDINMEEMRDTENWPENLLPYDDIWRKK